jgi:hypothetical protein
VVKANNRRGLSPVISGVRPLSFAAVVLLLLPAGAHPDQLSLDSSWEWGGRLAVRGGISLETTRLFWGCGDCAAGVKDPREGLFALGLSTPWLRAGPLTPSGLLRVAYNPLGFSPQSDVFFEPSGLAMERSPGSGRPGFLLMPLPGVLGLYCLKEPQGDPAYGCFASLLSPEGSGAECFLSLSQPDAESSGEEWFPSRVLFPGGKLLVAGTRFRISVPGVSCIATLGTSRGERVGPGGFWQLRALAYGQSTYATLLAAGMEESYRTPRGTAVNEAVSFAAAGGFSGPSGSVGLRYSLLFDQPELAPHPCRATKEVFEARIERMLAHAGGAEISLNLKGEKRVSHDEEGIREDSSRYTVALKWQGRDVETVMGVDFLEPDGLALFLTAALPGKGRQPRFSLESRWENRFQQSPQVTELLTLRMPGPASSLCVQSGIACLPLSVAPTDPGDCFRMKISWSVSASPVSRQDHLPLQGEPKAALNLSLHQLDQSANIPR